MLKQGDLVSLVACSDGLGPSGISAVEGLRESLLQLGLRVTTGLPLDRAYGSSLDPATAHPAPDEERAEHLMLALESTDIAAVFDVSGGQLASGVLTFLDPARLARTSGFFMGFSNLTMIVNALYSAGAIPSLLANPRLLQISSPVRSAFEDACLASPASTWLPTPARPGTAFVTPRVSFVRGTGMSGPVLGGNLSGLLSLAGTPWFPSCDGAILALEGLSPSYSTVAVGIHQLRQMGALKRVAGILLGQFTAAERSHGPAAIPALARELIPNIPVATTSHFGHSDDGMALMIGETLTLQSSGEPLVNSLR